MSEQVGWGDRPTSVRRGETKKGASWVLVTTFESRVIHAVENAISAVIAPLEQEPQPACIDRPTPGRSGADPTGQRREGDGVDRRHPSQLTTGELLARTRADLRELQRRGVLRGDNAPAGDYAEWLVRRATTGELAPNSQRSWDVLTADGERLQVKARIVTDHRTAGQRQLSVIRSWDFDAVVVVLFNDSFRVWKAVRLPADVCREVAYFIAHVNGYRLMATDGLLARGEDWTDQLRRHCDAD